MSSQQLQASVKRELQYNVHIKERLAKSKDPAFYVSINTTELPEPIPLPGCDDNVTHFTHATRRFGWDNFFWTAFSPEEARHEGALSVLTLSRADCPVVEVAKAKGPNEYHLDDKVIAELDYIEAQLNKIDSRLRVYTKESALQPLDIQTLPKPLQHRDNHKRTYAKPSEVKTALGHSIFKLRAFLVWTSYLICRCLSSADKGMAVPGWLRHLYKHDPVEPRFINTLRNSWVCNMNARRVGAHVDVHNVLEGPGVTWLSLAAHIVTFAPGLPLWFYFRRPLQRVDIEILSGHLPLPAHVQSAIQRLSDGLATEYTAQKASQSQVSSWTSSSGQGDSWSASSWGNSSWGTSSWGNSSWGAPLTSSETPTLNQEEQMRAKKPSKANCSFKEFVDITRAWLVEMEKVESPGNRAKRLKRLRENAGGQPSPKVTQAWYWEPYETRERKTVWNVELRKKNLRTLFRDLDPWQSFYDPVDDAWHICPEYYGPPDADEGLQLHPPGAYGSDSDEDDEDDDPPEFREYQVYFKRQPQGVIQSNPGEVSNGMEVDPVPGVTSHNADSAPDLTSNSPARSKDRRHIDNRRRTPSRETRYGSSQRDRHDQRDWYHPSARRNYDSGGSPGPSSFPSSRKRSASPPPRCGDHYRPQRDRTPRYKSPPPRSLTPRRRSPSPRPFTPRRELPAAPLVTPRALSSQHLRTPPRALPSPQACNDSPPRTPPRLPSPLPGPTLPGHELPLRPPPLTHALPPRPVMSAELEVSATGNTQVLPRTARKKKATKKKKPIILLEVNEEFEEYFKPANITDWECDDASDYMYYRFGFINPADSSSIMCSPLAACSSSASSSSASSTTSTPSSSVIISTSSASSPAHSSPNILSSHVATPPSAGTPSSSTPTSSPEPSVKADPEWSQAKQLKLFSTKDNITDAYRKVIGACLNRMAQHKYPQETMCELVPISGRLPFRNANCTIVPLRSGSSAVLGYRVQTTIAEELPWFIVLHDVASAVEILRRGWGPGMSDIARQLLQRGIPFRTMYVPSSSVAPIPEVPFVHYDVFPYNHKFCRNDYVLHKQRVEAFFRLPHARAALLMGGIVWRIAVEVLDLEHVLFGPSGSRTYQHTIKLAEGDAVDDRLSQAECDLICGVSHVLNSHQAVDSASDVSWWPKQDTFERDSWGFWSWRDEVWYRARREEIHSDDPEKAGPKAAWSWRNTFKQGSRQRAAMEMLEREGTGLIR